MPDDAKIYSASFRKVPFKIRSTSDTEGVRKVVNARPGEGANVQDVDEPPSEFTLQCFFCGLNYAAERDAFKAALRKPGEGELIHPYYGKMQVSVRGQFSTSHSVAGGDIAEMSVTFVLAGKRQYPVARKSRKKESQAAVWAAIHRIVEGYDSIMNVLGSGSFVRAAAEGEISSLLNKLEDSLLPRLLDNTEGRQIIRALRAEAGSLLGKGDFTGLGQRLVAIFMSSVRGFDSARSVLDTLGGFIHYAIPKETGSAQATPSRRQQAQNNAATEDLVQASAWCAAVMASTHLEFARYRDPLQLRDALSESFQTNLSDQHALWSVYQAMLDDLTTRAKHLGRLVSKTPAATEPVQVTTYRHYGNLEPLDTVLTNNAHVTHPSYVPGGEPVELLTKEAS